MKSRSGFVSNSSSSSFVIIGKFIDFDEDEMKRILKRAYGFTNESLQDEDDVSDLFYETVGDDPDIAYGHEPGYFGVLIGSGSELEEFEISLKELQEKAESFSIRFGYDINEIKLIGGTENC